MATPSDSEANALRQAALSEAEDLIDRLYAEEEARKRTLIRTIHDDLGGLLVSAAMDFTSVRQRLPEGDLPVLEQFERGRKTLESAIALSRSLVEELRPSILDNFGLFAALRWQLRRASEGSGAALSESYPSVEPAFQPAALTTLFRVAEEAIGKIFNRGNVRSASVNLQIENGGITMRFADDGIPDMASDIEGGATNPLSSMKHRIRALGGTVELVRSDASGTIIQVYMPLSKEAEPQAH